jgi:V/A-type H+-transporting ATPase subunit K
MVRLLSVILASLVPMGLAVYFTVRQRRHASTPATKRLVWGVTGFNIVLAMLAMGLGIAWLSLPTTAMAAEVSPQASSNDPYQSLATAIATGLSAIGAGISVGGAAIGAGIAVGGTGAAAVGTIAEKPESLGRALIFVGLAEGIAIYGLIISFMVLNR